jgi:hypothetical protein
MSTRASTIDTRKQQLLDCIGALLHSNPYRLFVEELLTGADEALLRKLSSIASVLSFQLSSNCSRSPDAKDRQNESVTSTIVAASRKRKKSSHDVSAVHRFFISSDLVAYLCSFLELDTHHSLAHTSVCMMGVAGVALPARMRSTAPWRKHLKLRASITNTQLTRLCSYACLTSLDLSGCYEITDDSLLSLRFLRINRLDLNMGDPDIEESCGNITDAGLGHLEHLPLEHLDLTGCDITDSGLTSLRQLPLKHPNLAYCRDITDGGLVHL